MAIISITDIKTGEKKTITTPKNLSDLEALQQAKKRLAERLKLEQPQEVTNDTDADGKA